MGKLKYVGKHVSNKVGPDGKPIERFYHITERLLGIVPVSDTLSAATLRATRGTVFFRREANGWFAAVARCSPRDNPSRETGRNVARRRYFKTRDETPRWTHLAGPFEKPSYEIAKGLYEGR